MGRGSLHESSGFLPFSPCERRDFSDFCFSCFASMSCLINKFEIYARLHTGSEIRTVVWSMRGNFVAPARRFFGRVRLIGRWSLLHSGSLIKSNSVVRTLLPLLNSPASLNTAQLTRRTICQAFATTREHAERQAGTDCDRRPSLEPCFRHRLARSPSRRIMDTTSLFHVHTPSLLKD